MEWKTVKLGEVCDLIAGFAFKAGDFGNFPQKVVKIGDITPPHVTYASMSGVDMSKYDEKRLEKYKVQYGDYVLAMTGATIGKVGKYIDSPFAYLNQRVLMFKPKSEVDTQFINYVVCSAYFRQYVMNHIDSESAQPNISATTISKYEFPLPPLETQRRIAAILSSLDDKIENNNRINRNLEAQAQALFKSWFVDFEPFGGTMPDDWREISLADIMNYEGGSQPPASEFIEEEKEGYVRFIQIRDYASDGHITYIPISKKNRLCEVEDIMIARYGASLGRICYGIKGAYNVALAKVYPKQSYYREFLRCFLNTRDFYEGINMKGNRAVQAGFNKSDIQSFLLPFPKNDNIVKDFENICSSLFHKRMLLSTESARLATLRDTLLPKLMKGEIEL